MQISIFGLGYVGAVAAGCLCRDGHEVIGVDPAQVKVDLINQGQTPVIEAEIGEIIAAPHAIKFYARPRMCAQRCPRARCR